ncbi:hypothetical protein L861_21065 [Litchfieldella anticariensis FP35 = DSM 16096]|uniref:Sec-independent protein translocase protein TatB n=1 Tax=Litchfieldella anticariensis (strain DSM 16096 / CECT 5854 / CIP 108499 / LMG 22089 / FP35) TaxID=1121939 RepID=S2KIC2_LITA3|nr:Sec-independent protein translocase protein TatB [Halomonas anticariensis]EPC01720.1 hypothetical protein L861_21065 [Halomonas anticariensis FP35 = DSM 16096]
MFDIGFLELLIIGVVGLLVLGPERLPKAARTAGLWVGKIKRTVSGMQREISAQLEAEELRQKLNEQQKKLDESLSKVKRDVEQYAEEDAKDKKDSKASASEGDSAKHTEQALDTPTDDSAATSARDKDSRSR